MTKPYGIVSDIHAHNWSAFSTVMENGVNNRLNSIICEVRRCAKEVKAAGGNLIINAGDVFHVRGSIAPSVLNPIIDLHRELVDDGMEIWIIAGNHDAELKDVTRVSSAITALESAGCHIINETFADANYVLIPWIPDIARLKDEIIIRQAGYSNPSVVDLIIHAPVNCVIMGIPDHGLDAKWLGGLGFRNVFAGHYHNHKDFGNNVYSIGAINHHTWGDVGSKAGFLIVDDGGVKWFKSHSPEFIEIDGSTDPSEIPLLVDGNYVRIKTSATEIAEIESIRELLVGGGAKGVTIIAQKESSVTPRGTASVASGMSLEASVENFVSKGGFDDAKALSELCGLILNEAKGDKV